MATNDSPGSTRATGGGAGAPAAGDAARDDAFAAGLRGFGPLGLHAIAVVFAGDFLFSPLSAVLALAWAWRSRTPWSALGLACPRGWGVNLLAHPAGQGWPGVRQATIVGSVFACLYARTRSLWGLIAAHAAFDIMALALIHWRLEAGVAGYFFHP